MVHAATNTLGRFASAARSMVEGNLADEATGCFSKTVFLASDGRHPFLIDATLNAARDYDLGAVVLEFGFGSHARGPRSWTVAAMIDGEQVIVRDCALWIGGQGKAVLIPRAAKQTEHFVMTECGLVRCAGNPAPSLAAGTIRAANRLVRLARTIAKGPSFGIGVIDLPLAA